MQLNKTKKTKKMLEYTEDGWRYPVDHTHHHRENGWDYKGRAIYHFTLAVEQRYPLFGVLQGDSAETARVQLNSFGHKIYQTLRNLPKFYAGKGFAFRILALKVMPDHLHVVVHVLEPLPKSIGAVVRGFKSACSMIYKRDYFVSGGENAGFGGGENAAEVHKQGERTEGDREPGGTKSGEENGAGFSGGENAAEVHKQGERTEGDREPGGTKSGEENGAGFSGGKNAAEVHKQGGTRTELQNEVTDEVFVNFNPIFANRGSIWQQDPAYYHERILHHKGQLNNMIQYVKDNPRRLWLRKQHPDLFRLHRQTEVEGLFFTSLGNHFLLDWPDRQLIEVSRSATDDQVQQRLQLALSAAQNGTITYTAAISKGEQFIARTLREQGFPLVVLLYDGFPEVGSPKERYYKPGGVYFKACSKGQLLLLEPTEQAFCSPVIRSATEETLHRKAESKHYAFTSIPATSQRYRFVALNEIGRRLATRK